MATRLETSRRGYSRSAVGTLGPGTDREPSESICERSPGHRRVKTLLLLAIWLLFAGCGEIPKPTPGDDAVPMRLIALAPNMVELLFELGLGDRVVGVGDYVHWPPETQALPHLGGLLDPHLEEIVQLAPDLVLLLRSEADLGRKLAELGIATLVVPADTLQEVESAFSLIADHCGVEEEGRRATESWRRAIASERGQTTRRALLVVGRPQGVLREVYVAGRDTFLSQLADRIGAENIFGDLDIAYPQVGLDAILARRPEIILELQGEPLDDAGKDALKSDWKELFGETTRVEVLSGSHVLVPGPRIPQLLDELAAAIEGSP